MSYYRRAEVIAEYSRYFMLKRSKQVFPFDLAEFLDSLLSSHQRIFCAPVDQMVIDYLCQENVLFPEGQISFTHHTEIDLSPRNRDPRKVALGEIYEELNTLLEQKPGFCISLGLDLNSVQEHFEVDRLYSNYMAYTFLVQTPVYRVVDFLQ